LNSIAICPKVLLLKLFLGYNVTGQWVMDTLNSYNYFKVERQDFTVPRYVELAPPTLAQVYPNPTNFTYGTDFVAFQFAKSGDVTANISAGKSRSELKIIRF
jgi:hypothetical protein